MNGALGFLFVAGLALLGFAAFLLIDLAIDVAAEAATRARHARRQRRRDERAGWAARRDGVERDLP